MTFYLLKALDSFSHAMYQISENAANNAELDLFIGSSWDDPSAVRIYMRDMGYNINVQEDILTWSPITRMFFGDVHTNTLNLRKDIYGWVSKIRDKPKTESDCITDPYYEGPSPLAMAGVKPGKDL